MDKLQTDAGYASGHPDTLVLETSEHDVCQHLDLLYRDLPGFIEVRSFGPNHDPRQTFCESRDEARAQIMKDAHAERDVYIGGATRRDPQGSGGKDNLMVTPTVWVDVDDLVDIGVREELDIMLEAFEPQPNLTIWSGGGRHLYWILPEPMSVVASANQRRLERVNRALAQTLGGDPSCVDVSRIMRVAGTVNWARGKAGRVPTSSFVERISI